MNPLAEIFFPKSRDRLPMLSSREEDEREEVLKSFKSAFELAIRDARHHDIQCTVDAILPLIFEALKLGHTMTIINFLHAYPANKLNSVEKAKQFYRLKTEILEIISDPTSPLYAAVLSDASGRLE
jgi:hypothetical protein